MNFAQNTELLKNKLVSDINASSLPITLKKYVVADIFRELEAEYIKQLAQKEDDVKHE